MGNYLRKMKFAAVALLATTTQATNAWAGTITKGFHDFTNCTAEAGGFQQATCNTTHYTLTKYTDNKCQTQATVTVSGKTAPMPPSVYEFGTCQVQGAAGSQWGVKASWKSAKALMAGSAAALAVAATLY